MVVFSIQSKEPVVHSGKWATSSHQTGEFPWFPAKTEEPVDHSGKWTTSSDQTGEFPWFPAKTKEPVVQSRKWTTSSRQTCEFPLISGKNRGASGPLAPTKSATIPDFDCYLQVTSPQARPSPKVRAFQSLSVSKATRR